MKLTVIWHKVFWPSARSPTGYAAHGGVGRQIAALSELFDVTTIVGSCSRSIDAAGERPLAGTNVRVVSLAALPRAPWLAWLFMPYWLLRNGPLVVREISRSDVAHPILPSPVALVALFVGLVLGKRLLVRPMNRWDGGGILWRLERALLERIAGDRNVVFATGDSAEPPSRRNSRIRWIFTTTVSESELAANALPRRLLPGGARLIIVGRQLESAATRVVLQALPGLAVDFPGVRLDVVGHGPALAGLRRLAADLGVADRVVFHGAVDHEGVLALLRRADLFCLPAAENESVRQVVHEALASGLPVVTTRESGTAALIGTDAGVVLDQASPEAAAGAIRACLTDSERYGAMSTAAVSAARGRSLERWREIVHEALEQAWGPLTSGDRTRPPGATERAAAWEVRA